MRDNRNLTEEERTYLLEHFTPVFEENAPFIDAANLAFIISKLRILRVECRKDNTTGLWGQYASLTATMTLYTGDAFAEAIAHLPSGAAEIPLHELFHLMGQVDAGHDPDYDIYHSVLEGVNEMMTREYFGAKGGNPNYDRNVAMAGYACELFGPTRMRDAFFEKYNGPLYRHVRENSGLDAAEAQSAVTKLLEDIQLAGRTGDAMALGNDLAPFPFLAAANAGALAQVYLSQITGHDFTGLLRSGERFTAVAIAYFSPNNPDGLPYQAVGPVTVTIRGKNGSTRTITVDAPARG